MGSTGQTIPSTISTELLKEVEVEVDMLGFLSRREDKNGPRNRRILAYLGSKKL
jgi:hypothetical protein